MAEEKKQTMQAETVPAEQGISPWKEMWDRLRRNKAAMLGLFIVGMLVFFALFGRFITPYDPNYGGSLKESLQGPSAQHWLGTDEMGRDMLSRIIAGAAISLRVGLTAVAVALSAGMLIGSVAGYYGGRIDMILMRLMDIMLAFPSLLLAIAFMSVLGRGIENAIIAISIVTIPQYARIVRGSVLSVKENEYVQAARAIGNPDWKIIFFHVIPNILPPVIVRATLGISVAILDTSALGFLGLGVQPPAAEWGTMLGAGRAYFFNANHLVLFPGLAITFTVMAFNLLGDGLRDALDPRNRKE